MSRIAYVNGRYLPQDDAFVHIEDRGYQFSDGIYEYIAFYNRTLLDGEAHLKRLERSLKEISIAQPVSTSGLQFLIRELIARNGRDNGGLYIQITRGVARRDHTFPKSAKPSLVMTICSAKTPKPHEMENGVNVITHPDQRWQRRDIKSVSLLANILAKQAAASAGAREAWLVEENGIVTEGSASNAYIVTASGELQTHPANEHILGGITRDVVLKLARKAGIPVTEHPFTLTDVRHAAEAFTTSTSINILPVVRVGDIAIGKGQPGEVTRKLQALYNVHVLKQTGWEF